MGMSAGVWVVEVWAGLVSCEKVEVRAELSNGSFLLLNRTDEDLARMMKRLVDDFPDDRKTLSSNLLSGLLRIRAAEQSCEPEVKILELNKLLRSIIHLPQKFSQSEVVLDFFRPSAVDRIFKVQESHPFKQERQIIRQEVENQTLRQEVENIRQIENQTNGQEVKNQTLRQEVENIRQVENQTNGQEVKNQTLKQELENIRQVENQSNGQEVKNQTLRQEVENIRQVENQTNGQEVKNQTLKQEVENIRQVENQTNGQEVKNQTLKQELENIRQVENQSNGQEVKNQTLRQEVENIRQEVEYQTFSQEEDEDLSFFQSPAALSEVLRSNGFCLANTETVMVDLTLPTQHVSQSDDFTDRRPSISPTACLQLCRPSVSPLREFTGMMRRKLVRRRSFKQGSHSFSGPTPFTCCSPGDRQPGLSDGLSW